MAERDLIEKIEKALNKLKGTTRRIRHVKITHGQFEFGVDILFDYVDAFGQMRVYGMQVKLGDIGVETLKDLFWQTNLAFNYQFAFPEEGTPRPLDGMYIVTDGQFKPGASAHFKSIRMGFREVFVIDKDNLEPFLAGTLPEMDWTDA